MPGFCMIQLHLLQPHAAKVLSSSQMSALSIFPSDIGIASRFHPGELSAQIPIVVCDGRHRAIFPTDAGIISRVYFLCPRPIKPGIR